ncbi:SRPBCC family protein [Pontibacter russatus]|uniref:SRPBCC family protein n=1 Tax=Pontibacter russatus TaxID=2694929 RepID=UPI00137B7A96|nr:SRPBCC family protein [Pontibacter russatus]
MESTAEKTIITVETTIHAPVEKTWQFWTEPQHITQWNNASDDWHTPKAENDLREGGSFTSRMETKDGSMGFDFAGTYTTVKEHERIEYTMEDGRKVRIMFASNGNVTHVTETFDADNSHPAEMQRAGWQAILDNFKKYVEASGKSKTLHYEITIQAPAEKVYRTMLDKKHYREWAAEFNPTSHYEGSWDKGAKILFLGSDKDGNTGGMVSRIKENIPSKFVSIEHLGIVQHGAEITSGPEVEGWAGALENYTFSETESGTLLSVNTDTNQEFEAYFSETWPKALQKLKAICEAEA